MTMKKRRRTIETTAPMYLMIWPPWQADLTTNFSDISRKTAIEPNLLHSQFVTSGDVSMTSQKAGSQAPLVPKSGFHQTHCRISTPSRSMSECQSNLRLVMRAKLGCLWYNVTLKSFNVFCCLIGWCLLSFSFHASIFLMGHLHKNISYKKLVVFQHFR